MQCSRVLRERKSDSKSNDHGQKAKNVIQKRSYEYGDQKENNLPLAPKKEKVLMSKAKRRKIFGSIKENEMKSKARNYSNTIKNSVVNVRGESKEETFIASTPRTTVSDLSMSSPQSAFLKKLLADVSNENLTRNQIQIAKPTFCMRDLDHISPRTNQVTITDSLKAHDQETSYIPQNVVEFRSSLHYIQNNQKQTQTKSSIREKLTAITSSAATATRNIFNLLECRMNECFVPTPTSPVCITKSDHHDMHSI